MAFSCVLGQLHIESLPSEIHSLILGYCEKEELTILRLVSKTLHGPATRILFSTVYVNNTKSGIAIYQNILSSPQLANEVRHIVFRTMDVEASLYNPRDPIELSEEFENALESTYQFPNLFGVGLHYSEECSAQEGDEWPRQQVVESLSSRTKVLKALLRGLNNPLYSEPTVRSLSIVNLQNINDPNVAASQDFLSVLSRLTEFCLRIINEWDCSSPESSWSFPAMHQFFQELPSVWLEPLKGNIIKLKLYADELWGYLPKVDFRGFYFPKLRKLHLGNYIFSHDWQFEWFWIHGQTLEELVLDGCHIMHYARHLGRLDYEGYAADPKISQGPDALRTYERRWSDVFAEMECKLPALKKFHFAISSWCGSDLNYFEEWYWEICEWGGEGYIVYDRGAAAYPWIENRRPRAGSYSFPTAEFEKDRAAYEKLMTTLEGRRAAGTASGRT